MPGRKRGEKSIKGMIRKTCFGAGNDSLPYNTGLTQKNEEEEERDFSIKSFKRIELRVNRIPLLSTHRQPRGDLVRVVPFGSSCASLFRITQSQRGKRYSA